MSGYLRIKRLVPWNISACTSGQRIPSSKHLARYFRLVPRGYTRQHCGVFPEAGVAVRAMTYGGRNNTYCESVNEFLAWHDFHACQPIDEIHFLLDIRGITFDTQCEKANSASAPECKQADTL